MLLIHRCKQSGIVSVTRLTRHLEPASFVVSFILDVLAILVVGRRVMGESISLAILFLFPSEESWQTGGEENAAVSSREEEPQNVLNRRNIN
mmetsp:Transcript_29370/g.61451  ORF Transcript_29370/g.61451 Transcript_29370/m.61451 type:complete len:92 (+) Transcript_29370:854-1129(+)